MTHVNSREGVTHVNSREGVTHVNSREGVTHVNSREGVTSHQKTSNHVSQDVLPSLRQPKEGWTVL